MNHADRRQSMVGGGICTVGFWTNLVTSQGLAENVIFFFNKRKSFLDISLFTKCFTLAQGSSQQCQSPTAEQWKGIKITARLFAWAKGAGWAPPNQTFTHSSQGGEGRANTSTGNQAPWLTCFPKFYRGMTETNVGLEGERRKQGCSQDIFKFFS